MQFTASVDLKSHVTIVACLGLSRDAFYRVIMYLYDAPTCLKVIRTKTA